MNMVANEDARRPGRPKREEVTRTERRRRKGGASHKLKIPQSVLDAHPDMEFRWGKDDEGRIQQLTQNDDWDAVPDVAPIHAGVGKAGNAVKMHLLMKPRRFMEEDRSEKMQRLDDLEKAQLARPEAKQAIAQGSEIYSVPGNKI